MAELKTIALFGATGKTGKAILHKAESHHIAVNEVNVRNATDDEITQKITGVAGVVIVFGPRPPYKDIFCARETKRIIDVMNKVKVTRLICQTGAMIGDYPENRSVFFSLLCTMFRTSNPEGHQDRVNQEAMIKNSKLNWTIIKPPKLSEGKERKVYAGSDVKVGLLSSLSRDSLANFIIKEIFSPTYIRQLIFIRN